MSIPYKSFCWSIGTTSFRTKKFNKTIEEQLSLLDEFWQLAENSGCTWEGNVDLQTRYYDYMQGTGFVEGTAHNKPKDAREKTSGLVDIGLLDDGRCLTEAGKALLEISRTGDFATNNLFLIPKDSYIYLKQLLKMCVHVSSNTVRPFVVLLYALTHLEYLSEEEFTYLLPLCTNAENTAKIIGNIQALRRNELCLDDIILAHLLEMNNYQAALNLWLDSTVNVDSLCEIGLNRKSRKYDISYFPLYQRLHAYYLGGDQSALIKVYEATRNINIGKLWRGYLFNTSSVAAITKKPQRCKKTTIFDSVSNEREFKTAFFKVMHLLKAKATLSDYFDLNRRYVKTADIVLFSDNRIRLDIIPNHFFRATIRSLYADAFTETAELASNCTLESINAGLVINEQTVIDGVNSELNTQITTLAEARRILDDNRYMRWQHLLDTKFSKDKLLVLLDCFENRNNGVIQSMVTDNADVPTIFEYVLGILWYMLSERQGRILDYMKLSLDADLLPKTHAVGGEADIVYEYQRTAAYPNHTLLLEATLADSTNQRRMEMEPVSRHLGRYLLRTGNLYSYCVFVTNYLDINVISDFRNRKTTPFYDTQDYSKNVNGMKIIPIQTSALKKIVSEGKTYKELYAIFEKAFQSTLPPHQWYEHCIKESI